MNMSEGGDSGSRPEAQGAEAPKPVAAYFRTIFAAIFGVAICAALAVWFLREPAASEGPAASSALQAARSGDPAARARAIRDVTQVGLAESKTSIPAMIEVLGDADDFIRVQAADSLGTLGSYAVWARMSGTAVEGADGGTIDAATKALLNSLAKDTKPAVRVAAAGGLRSIAATSPQPARPGRRSKKAGGDAAKAPDPIPSPVDYKTIVAALIAALADQDDTVRAAAASAMGAAGPKISAEPQQQLVAALKDQSAATRAAAGKSIPRFEHGLDPVLPILVRMAANDNQTVHEACMQALHELKRSAISAAAIPALVEALGSTDRQIRIDAISLLTQFGAKAKDAVPGLIAVLNEPLTSDSTTAGGRGGAFVTIYTGPAHLAAKALGEIVPGSPSAGVAVAALSRVVRGAARQRRSSAADALGKFGAAAAPAIPDLIKMLEEADAGKVPASSGDADAAAEALVKIAADPATSKAVVSALRASLRSNSKTSRAAVAAALEQLGPAAAEAAPELEALKNDSDPHIREAASKALEALTRK
jgi:HEAT repeat protein